MPVAACLRERAGIFPSLKFTSCAALCVEASLGYLLRGDSAQSRDTGCAWHQECDSCADLARMPIP